MAAIKLECVADITSGYPAGFVGICMRVAHESDALRTRDLARVTVDTTVQPNTNGLSA